MCESPCIVWGRGVGYRMQGLGCSFCFVMGAGFGIEGWESGAYRTFKEGDEEEKDS